jgi:ATP/maltotriose-dependent transcriptional regulator MalT
MYIGVTGGDWQAQTNARIAAASGDTATAWEIIDAVFPEGPATEPGNAWFIPAVELIDLAAHLALTSGDLDTADAWIATFERWMSWSGATVWDPSIAVLKSRLALTTGESARAQTFAAFALERSSDPAQPLVQLAAYRQLGATMTALAQYAEAEQNLNQALVLAEACAAPFERALTQLTFTELEVARGRSAAARQLLAEVRAICEPLRARPTLERLAGLEQRIGGLAE